MLLDTRRLHAGSALRTGVCVIGAGAAGITLARELDARGHEVCVLESGGLKPGPATQELLAGESTAPSLPLDEARLACLGGTTAAWAGWCRPLDPLDFEARPWVPHSGWPFDAPHLEPFYRHAHAVCGLGAFEYRAGSWARTGSAPLPLDGSVRTEVFQFSPPLHFGRAYRAELAASPNTTVLLHATALGLEFSEGGDAVTAVPVALPGGRRARVHAPIVVLAAGGIENPRLLLLSGRDSPDGPANRHGLVGRFFMEHPYVDSGSLLPSGSAPPLGFYRRHHVTADAGPGLVAGVFTLDGETVCRERLVNSAIFLRPRYRAHPVFRSEAVRAAQSLVNSLRRGSLPRAAAGRLQRAVRRPDRLALAAWLRLGIGGGRGVGTRAFAEPVPDPGNRVTLTDERDPLGRRRVRVEWMPGELERRSLDRAHELLDRSLRQAGLGRVEPAVVEEPGAWPPSLSGAGHHMGTTRMHRDPRQGVVDEHCRVHGIENLFIAGSSVFPTAGYANPTLTIVALALRLAGRIHGMMGSA